ncbi:MAG: OmpA family protein [Spirochaetales bacterium]|nr:OmpA family protein [Spirochaetales bacterium]
MKKFFFLLILISATVPNALEAQTVVQQLAQNKHIKVTLRYDLNRTVDGNYKGLFYGYALSNWTLKMTPEGGWSVIADNLATPESRTDPLFQEKAVLQSWGSTFSIDKDGKWSKIHGDPVPPYQDFPPAIPTGISTGDTWETSGFVFVGPPDGHSSVRIPFLAQLKYLGPVEWFGQKVLAVSARYALRYHKEAQGLVSAEGTRDDVIYYDTESGLPLFLRENVTQQFEYLPQKTVTENGFILCFYEGFLPMNRLATAENLTKDLQKAQIRDVDISPSNQGVRLTLNNLLFVADRAVLLPGEELRLSQIAQALNAIPDRDFQVIGYTADVGSQESQVKLSVERALAIVKALEEHGVSPRRLFYEGRGGKDPVATNATEAGRSLNRRVEILIRND